MKQYLFEHAYTQQGWQENLLVDTDIFGQITSMSFLDTFSHKDAEQREGFALPSFVNGHSHAFQYEMVGLTENLPMGSNGDDFWSWRARMYELALRLQPEDMYEIALALYTRMLKRGYGSVAEFHYLHHQPDGTMYEHRAHMGEALMAAAQEAGIDLCLVPIWYANGGFNKPPSRQQRRFVSKSLSEYLELYQSTLYAAQKYDHCYVGMGIHSLRAVGAQDIIDFFTQAPTDIPIHLHIAEQEQEIIECEAHLGMRPVEWLAKNITLTENINLIHATHLTVEECTILAKSPSCVVICPSTEANLGDGVFPLQSFHRQGGRWCFGTDSHIGLDPLLELQLLEYGQRLTLRKRNILCTKEGDDTGSILFDHVHECGGSTVAAKKRGFLVGAPLSTVVYPDRYPICSVDQKHRISGLIFSGEPQVPMGIQQRNRWIEM
jgi:formimidoylglutamate deiminase